MSLDTELALGHYFVFNRALFSSDGERERKAVSQLIDMFEKYDIAVTWALVGHIFSQGYDGYYPAEWEGKYPEFQKLFEQSHPLMHGADLVQQIKSSSAIFEIACHGFSHKIFSEDIMSDVEAKKEIKAWKTVAVKEGFKTATMVFPNNREGHHKLLRKEGFLCYRGEELTRPLFRGPFLGRLFRRLYYYLVEFSQPVVYVPEIDQASGLVNLPSSRWMFGLNRKVANLLDGLGFHKLRMRGIAKGVRKAAEQKKVIHVWAHPYEFETERDFERLEYLLLCVKKEIELGRMVSMTMGGLAKRVLDPQKSMAKSV